MYTNPRYTTRVHDGSAFYGLPPIPSDPYPAAGVLEDLKTAPDHEAPAIVARYVALRAWLVRADGGPVADHAVSAAGVHLGSLTGPGRPGPHEAALLEAALAAPTESRAWVLLERAADEATRHGHVHGARTLRTAVHRARWLAARLPPPSAS